MDIRQTQSNEIPVINQLIAASKSYWPYPESYLQAALPLLRIDENWLKTNLAFTLLDNDNVIGFLGLETEKDHWHLEHLWITPNTIKQGYGRQAITFLKQLAKDHSINTVSLFPDPPAEGFYERQGARFSGRNVPSRIPGGPTFQEMHFHL